ncbi:hypothetical protein CAEBREN_07895 [Caenorhabditis brenneri]|uniref:F-box domain-containing protein n=1 Tax=Caenorhabditis brenneri TaxID=135651 RepID=G0NCP1_CAEBE|nr:hypothetical protein CAEBREN_07895 [Caenorhabditis brenneri]
MDNHVNDDEDDKLVADEQVLVNEEEKSEDVAHELTKNISARAEKSRTFPFWRLPALTRSRVTKFMKPLDIILLTMTSTPFKRFMKSYKLSGMDLLFLLRNVLTKSRFVLHTDDNNFGISLRFPNSPSLKFVFPKQWKTFGEWKNVNGEPMQIEKWTENAVIFGGDLDYPQKFKFMEQLAKHLVDIIHVDKHLLSASENKNFNLFDCFIWNFVPKFHQIHLGDLRFSYHVTPEQLRFLLNVVNCDHMLLNLSVEENVVEGLQLKSKSLEVSRFGDWLTMEYIIESECEEISGQIEKVQPAETVKLVKEWRAGEKLTNIKMLDLHLSANQSLALKIIDKFNGVKKLTETEKQILENGEMKGKFPSGEVRKIRRATDGKIAVLSVNRDLVKMKVLENGGVLKDF